MTGHPLISVVMPAFDCDRYLTRSIDSILSQSYINFELIIVCDSPSGVARKILDDYSKKDSRIKVIPGDHRGVIAARNKGSRLARGKYVAVQDCDDTSLPHRLQHQLEYLESNPQVGLIGTWARYVNEQGRTRMIYRTPENTVTMAWMTYLGNPSVHSSIMMRRELLERLGFYDERRKFGEDYDLVARASEITQVTDLPEVQVCYTVRSNSQSGSSYRQQEEMAIIIMEDKITRLLEEQVPAGRVGDLMRLMAGTRLNTMEQIEYTYTLIQRMQDAYIRKHKLNAADAGRIRRATGRKLYWLAFSAWAISPVRSVRYLAIAFRANPFLPLDRLRMKLEPLIIR